MLAMDQLIGDFLPRAIGLALVAFALAAIWRVRREFLIVARGWVVVAFMTTIALFWAYEAAMPLLADGDWARHPQVGIAFVVITSWLSVCVVSITTRYRRYAEADAFRRWFAKKPLNVISLWGMIGLVILAIAWTVGPSDEEGLDGAAWLLYVVSVYLGLSVVLDLVMPLSGKTRGDLSRLPRDYRTNMTLLASAWIGLPTLELAFDLVLRSAGIASFDFIYAWAMVAMFVLLLRSITASRFTSLIVHAEVEMGEKGGFRSYDIPRGIYLLEDESNRTAMALFSELVTRPLRPDATVPSASESPADTLSFLIPTGLVVTRVHPDRVREEYGLQVTPILWLTESPGERRIAPTSIAVLTDTVTRFMESNPNSIVFIDGVEYLVTHNDFRRVLGFLDSLNETAWITKSRLLISLNAKSLDARELAVLERDRTVVRGPEEIGELKTSSEALGESEL
jgi:hypothetical protein